MFLPQPFSNGLARLPRNFFLGSLIPLPPFGGGRAATQSASRGSLVVQYWPDYKVANRLVYSDAELPSEFLRHHARLSSNIRGTERRNGKPLSESGSIFQQPIQRYFSLAEGQYYRRLVPFI